MVRHSTTTDSNSASEFCLQLPILGGVWVGGCLVGAGEWFDGMPKRASVSFFCETKQAPCFN
jgi:hypothetical protein